MKVRDSKPRGGISASGEGVAYQVRRYRCGHCKTIHTELPSDLAPRLRHEADAVQAALDGSDAGFAAEGSTVYRWRGYLVRLAAILASAGLLMDELRKACGRWLAESLKIIYSGGAKHTLNALTLQAKPFIMELSP
jgi:hypothetical protein